MDKKEEKQKEKSEEPFDKAQDKEQVREEDAHECLCEDGECAEEKGKNKFKEKLEECEYQYKRALADYQNLEKRVREERSHWVQTANKDLLFRMLPVLDTLMLAKQHATDKTIEVTINQFLDLLKSEGVERIKTEGEKFNPHVMEAISAEEGDEGKVLKEMRAGYKMGDNVLRVAQVIVGKGTSN